MKVYNSKNISLEFTPWTDNSLYRVTKLQMYEELGGIVPRGVMSLEHDGNDEALKLITDEDTGIIKLQDNKEGGIQLEIPIFITKKSTFQNILNMEFVCTEDKKFYTDLISESYPSITDAIQTVYPGKNKNILLEPDSGVDGIAELQNGETSFDFCKRLCYSYKANSVFAFGWEGLLIKDIQEISKDSKGNDLEITGGRLMQTTKPYQLNYNKRLNHEPYNPWDGQQGDDMLPTTKKSYSSVLPKNVGVVMEYSDYKIVGKDYIGHMMNQQTNLRLMDSNLYTNFELRATDIPSYKIGDVVKYANAGDETQNPFTKFLIKSNELFWTSDDSDGEVDWTGLRFSWTSKLVGLDKGTWTEE